MKRRLLGKTGFEASMLGIGDLADRSVPLEKCVATLHRAMDYGLNLIDTAPRYESGYSEQIVGAALKGRRRGMFVIDKIDHLDQPAGPQVDASLKVLGLDAVDLFVFHEVSPTVAMGADCRPRHGGTRPVPIGRQGAVPRHFQSSPRCAAGGAQQRFMRRGDVSGGTVCGPAVCG